MINSSETLLTHVTHKLNSNKFDDYNLRYWNIRSLKDKLFNVEDEININVGKTIHFIALTETKLHSYETDYYILPHYHSYHSTRPDGHGGAALFVQESINSSLIVSDCRNDINFVLVKIPQLRPAIAVVYKRPNVILSKRFRIYSRSAQKLYL